MKIYVPDASVILKWVIGEDDGRGGAHDLLSGWVRQKHDFLVPTLWRYEVANVLGLKKPDESEALMNILLDYHMEETAVSGEVLRVAFKLMRETRGSTFYDASYHAVAIVHKGSMVTADKACYSKVKCKDNIVLV